MKKKIIRPILFIFICLPAAYWASGQAYTSSYPDPAILRKANTVQFANYKPAPGKSGKDGSERLVLIRIGNGPRRGGNGKPGKDGPDLNVNIIVLPGSDSTLLRLTVCCNQQKEIDTFYVNPVKGQIKIIADGADGGAGGVGEYSVNDKASNGSGGRGGNGGRIEVKFDSSARKYAGCKCLLFSNEGGRGGSNQDRDRPELAAAGPAGPPVYIMDENGKILNVK